jgi:glycosyltransferase involved in cell wall biosynthesis
MKKIALVVTTPLSFNVFYKEHINYLKKYYDVTLIANFDLDCCDIECVKKIHINIQRKPSIIADIKALYNLICIFKIEKFDLVHSTTPKAGLLTQIAGRLSNIKVRLHTFTGQVWANKTGYKRKILKVIDRIIGYLPTHLLTDSHSQKQILEKEKIVPLNKITVLGLGSICGVELNKFKKMDKSEKHAFKRSLGFNEEDFIYLYLGRLNKDKGIFDLIKAFEYVYEKRKDICLLLVGRDEENILDLVQRHHLYNKAIFYKGFTKEPQKFMAMANVFCLPSYREGFGSVIIEASACGTPSIGTNIYGLSDAIEDNKSGLLCNVNDPNDLSDKMLTLVNDTEMLYLFSTYGVERVRKHFDSQKISEYLVAYYHKIL